MKSILKIIILFYFSIDILVSNTSNVIPNEKIKLQLQWKHQFEFAGFYAAKEKGFYKEVGLDVDFSEFKQNMNIVDEVLDGNSDYGLSYSTFIVDYMQGKPLVFVANFFKQSPLVLVTQKNIRTPADLKGKKIMGLLDSSHKQTILTMLNQFNITPHDFQNVPQKFNIQSFIKKDVDAISVFTTNEIHTLNKLGVQYNILDPAVFGTKFYDINLFTTKSELENNPKRVENFRNASIKGWEYALKHKEELADIIIQKYNTQNKSKEALLFEANQIEYLMLTNIYPIGSIELGKVEMIADTFAQSLLIPKESKEKLNAFIYKTKNNTLDLTIEQRNYLQKKKTLKMCIDPNWMPLEKIENGKHIGVAADFMEIISEKIHTPIQLIQTDTWTQSLQKIQHKECDFLALAEKTPKRQKYLNFTSPYVKIPLAIVTKQGVPFSNNLSNLQDKALGVVKNYSIVELLKIKYPHINLVEVDSIQEGLSYVDQEKIFGFLDNSMVINHEIQKNKMNNNISITGYFSEMFYLGIASRNDEPLLNEIFEKTLFSIDDTTREHIFNKWNNISYQLAVDYQVIAQIIFLGFVLVSIFIYWNFKLKEEIKNKELAQKQLKENQKKLQTLFDIAPVLLDSFDNQGRVTYWNQECEKIFGWSFEEIKNHPAPIKLFYPDPQDQEKLIESFNKRNYNKYEEWHPKTKEGKTLITMWANVKLPTDEIINIGYDITNQRQNELALKEKTEQLTLAKKQLEDLNNSLEERIKTEIDKNIKNQVILMHQSKLAQMGEMIENIAHQWRQPLAQINSSVLIVDAYLQKNKCFDTTIEKKLLEIESLTAYMSKTIDDFKNFFNPDKQKTKFKVKNAIEKSYNILKGSLVSKEIRTITTIDPKLECYGYLDELQQVILALLNNAIDALVLMNIESPLITVESYELEGYIYINIEDNASGIKKEIMNKIFEPYFTTKHKSQGTGLGLYMSKMIIEEGLGGNLNVTNGAKGALFTIQIPKGEE